MRVSCIELQKVLAPSVLKDYLGFSSMLHELFHLVLDCREPCRSFSCQKPCQTNPQICSCFMHMINKILSLPCPLDCNNIISVVFHSCSNTQEWRRAENCWQKLWNNDDKQHSTRLIRFLVSWLPCHFQYHHYRYIQFRLLFLSNAGFHFALTSEASEWAMDVHWEQGSLRLCLCIHWVRSCSPFLSPKEICGAKTSLSDSWYVEPQEVAKASSFLCGMVFKFNGTGKACFQFAM